MKRIEMIRWMLVLTLVVLTSSLYAAAEAPASGGGAGGGVALQVRLPAGAEAKGWPMQVGVPLPRGLVKSVGELSLVTPGGQTAECQLKSVSQWPDGSLRWVHLFFSHTGPAGEYRLLPGGQAVSPAPAPPAQPAAAGAPQVTVSREGKQLVVHTGAASYRFDGVGGCFESVELTGAGGRKLIEQAGNAFFVIDQRDRKGTLACSELKVEKEGPLHAVVRTSGEYRTADGVRLAAGCVYFHFYAGWAGVRISHKFIVSEETLDLWFKDVGVTWPLRLAGSTTAGFSSDAAKPQATTSVALVAGEAAALVQDDYPHFGSTGSHFAIAKHAGATRTEATSGAAAGNWSDISDATGGLLLEIPDFAPQFPKAVRAQADSLTVKLWAGAETGKELDYRTEQVVANYFGHDWIPADAPIAKAPNSAKGSARTHELWLTPHQGSLTPQLLARNTRQHEAYVVVDPAWIGASKAMEDFHPYDAERFGNVEAAIRDYYLKNVALPEKIFPNTGWWCWGRNPYVSAAWKLQDGRWYPTPHRLSRCLEYNLKRGVWVLYARSGDPLYRDYARRYTRFLSDFYISNWGSASKPLGWLMQGEPWDSPCFWGALDEKTIRGNEHPPFVSNISCLGYGTSEDVIQFVYDWFLCGEYHSRDAAKLYKEAMIKELAFDVDKALTVVPPYVLLRPMASAYEIDQDPRLYQYGHDFLARVVGDGSDVVNPQVGQNYVKSGEIWAGFHHYYMSTGDELALGPLLRVAQRYYRTNRMDIIYRGSGMPQALAYAYQQTKDPAYLAYLNLAIQQFANAPGSLAERGIDPEKVTRDFQKEWGHGGAMTEASPITVGIPVALQALADYGKDLPSVPMAIKPAATHKTYLLLEKTAAGPARVDLYVNNFGDAKVLPRLVDLQGRPAALKVVYEEAHEVDKPHGVESWQYAFNSFYGTYGTHLFWQLQIDAPPGIYHLETGRDVSMTVLYSDLTKMVQACPDGVVLLPNRPYFFSVSAGQQAIELFAHRPVEVLDPQGALVVLQPLGKGRYRLDTAGRGGTWQIRTGSDPFVYNSPYTRVESFVRFLNAPLVLALDQADRLFEVDASRFPSTIATDLPAAPAEQPAPLVERGRFGSAVMLRPQQNVFLDKLPAGAPRDQGTVEFWLQPLWSATQVDMEKAGAANFHQQLLHLEPLLVSYRLDSGDGRMANYGSGKLIVQLFRADKGSVIYPVVLYLEQGRWYHIAVTWQANGKSSDIEVFINGKRQTYADYHGGVPSNLQAADLSGPAQKLSFGSAISASHISVPGQLFDELRISPSIRYRESFTPQDQPFAFDDQCYLLMHLDADLQAQTAGGQTLPGRAQAGSKLRP